MLKKYSKQSFFNSPLYLWDSTKDPDLSMHPDLPKYLPYNLDPFVVSETHPDNFSLVEDDSKPHDVVF